MTLRRYAAGHVERLLARLAFELRDALASTTPDAVHDLRVAVRRFSQCLRIFKDALPSKAVKKIRRQVSEIREEAALIRDGDVLVEIFTKLGLAPDHALFVFLAERRAAEELKLRHLLRELSRKNYSAKWRAALIDPAPGSGTALAYARATLPELTRDYFATGAKLVAKERTPSELHAFRIETKRFRYTLEMFGELYGPLLKQRLRRLQKVQGILGDAHDCHVASDTLREFDPEHALVTQLKLDEAAHEQAFRELWAASFAPEGEAERWARYFVQFKRMVRR